MVETWAIVDSRDVILVRCEEGAECSDADQELIGGVPPYRVVHLVEAETVELAEVVKMAWATTVAETDDAHWFEFQKLAGLMRGLAVRKPHQLRACGIEVDDG